MTASDKLRMDRLMARKRLNTREESRRRRCQWCESTRRQRTGTSALQCDRCDVPAGMSTPWEDFDE